MFTAHILQINSSTVFAQKHNGCWADCEGVGSGWDVDKIKDLKINYRNSVKLGA